MLSRLLSFPRRLLRTGNGLRPRDYILAALSNPKEFRKSVNRYLARRSQAVESVVRAAEAPLDQGAKLPKNPSFDRVIQHLAQGFGVLVLDRQPTSLRLGIADVNMLTAVSSLARSILGLHFKIDGKTANLGMDQVKARIFAAREIEISFNNDEISSVKLILESYRHVDEGKWQSSVSTNRLLRAVYNDIFTAPGVTEALDILGGPSLRALAQSRPIDAVYTWVNHEDPDWAALYAKWTGAEIPEDQMAKSEDAEAMSRFHNNDELRYSLRSLEANAPWLRRIYVFSNCAPPAWLATDHPRLIWVRHEEVIPAEYLPTFSSHVIESYLHKIPGLSDHFIYLNDDFLITRPMEPRHFFNDAGQSLSRLESYGMVSGPVREGDPDYLNAARNSAQLIREALGFVPTQLHQHVPYALLRPVLAEMEVRFADPIATFRNNRFRRPNDLNIPSFFYHHYAMGQGRALWEKLDSIMVKSNDPLWQERLQKAESSTYYFICINEGGAEAPPTNWHSRIRSFLMEKFPKVAPWERQN